MVGGLYMQACEGSGGGGSDEQAFLDNLKAGEKDAWEEICGTYWKMSKPVAESVLRNTHDAEEVLSYSLLGLKDKVIDGSWSAWLKENKLKETLGNLKRYYFRVVKNKAIDKRKWLAAGTFLRLGGSHVVTHEPEILEFLANLQIEVIEFEGGASHSSDELLDLLQGRLTDDQFCVFELIWVQGMKGTEMAKKLGFSTAKISRIRRSLVMALRALYRSDPEVMEILNLRLRK